MTVIFWLKVYEMYYRWNVMLKRVIYVQNCGFTYRCVEQGLIGKQLRK